MKHETLTKKQAREERAHLSQLVDLIYFADADDATEAEYFSALVRRAIRLTRATKEDVCQTLYDYASEHDEVDTEEDPPQPDDICPGHSVTVGGWVNDDTFKRFIEYAKDAGNWSGTPLVGGNVGGDPADKGFITNMKKRGWITTWQDDDRRDCFWMQFTEEGKKIAKANGIEITDHND